MLSLVTFLDVLTALISWYLPNGARGLLLNDLLCFSNFETAKDFVFASFGLDTRHRRVSTAHDLKVLFDWFQEGVRSTLTGIKEDS